MKASLCRYDMVAWIGRRVLPTYLKERYYLTLGRCLIFVAEIAQHDMVIQEASGPSFILLAFTITSNKELQRKRRRRQSKGATTMRRRRRRRFLEQLRLSSAYRIVWAKKVERGKEGRRGKKEAEKTYESACQAASPSTDRPFEPARKKEGGEGGGLMGVLLGGKAKAAARCCGYCTRQRQQVRRQPLVCCGSYPVPPCTRPILKASEEAIVICLFRGFKPR